MNNIQYFEKQAKYWAKRLRIGNIIVKPKKMWAFAKVFQSSKTFFYNPKHVMDHNRYTLMEVIFHELGHLKNHNFSSQYSYDNNINKQISEYIAQRRAFYWLKKYYPKYYRSMLKSAKSYIKYCLTYPKNRSYYFEAFSQLPEYADHL